MAAPDPYYQLRPEPPTPPEEMCHCDPLPPIAVHSASINPLHCLACNGEVVPERIALSQSLAQEVAFWRTFYQAFDTLWLDSGEFEKWARRELADPGSVVNRRGLKVVSRLAELVPCYLVWFQERGAEAFSALANCPRCERALRPLHRASVCDGCRIAVYN